MSLWLQKKYKTNILYCHYSIKQLKHSSVSHRPVPSKRPTWAQTWWGENLIIMIDRFDDQSLRWWLRFSKRPTWAQTWRCELLIILIWIIVGLDHWRCRWSLRISLRWSSGLHKLCQPAILAVGIWRENEEMERD